MTADRAEIVRTLDTLMLFKTSLGHLAQRVTQESRGNCLPPGRCTPQCIAYRELLLDWIARLEACDADAPQQLALLEAAS